jgi:proline iminopeptidase
MRIEVNGVRIFFDVEGAKLVPDGPIMRERPTLILLHGGPGLDHSGYKPGMSQLADVCQVVYYDQRGHGRSDLSTPEHWNLEQWADDLVGLCAALEIEKPIVMGVSFGGNVAIAYATKYPAHPAKLILGSTRAATGNFEISLAVFERLGGAEAREVAKRFFDDPRREHFEDFIRVCYPLYNRAPRDHEEGQRRIRTDEVAQHFRRGEFLTMDYLSDLARVQCPALVFGGEDDPMVPIEFQEDIAAALPQRLVQFLRVPNAGHNPMRDDPTVYDSIREFILS